MPSKGRVTVPSCDGMKFEWTRQNWEVKPRVILLVLFELTDAQDGDGPVRPARLPESPCLGR